MSGAPRPPAGLGEAGRRLWRAVVGEFDPEPAEREVLRHACALADRAEDAAAELAESGLVTVDRYGSPKAHPLVDVERNSRLAVGRLLKSLGVAPAPSQTPRQRPGPSQRARDRAEQHERMRMVR